MTPARVLLRLGLLLHLRQIAAQSPPCSICSGGEILLNGDFVLPAGTAGLLTEDMACAEVEGMANAGSFSPASCSLLGIIIGDRCGCQLVIAPTDSPIAAETPAPVPSPPTEVPVASVVTDPPVTEAPVATVAVTEAPVATIATEAPVATIATEAPVATIATEAPVATVVVTEVPVETPVEPPTEAPVEALPTDSPTTDSPSLAPVETSVTVSPTTPSPITGAPSIAPILAPVTQPQPSKEPTDAAPLNTTAPTGADAGAPTVMSEPSAAPVATVPTPGSLVDLEVRVFFRLVGMERGELPDEADFETACITFLSEKVESVSNWTCTVARSQAVDRKLRALQTANLEVEANIEGKSASLSEEEFSNAVFQALNDNSGLFLASLKGSNFAYESVESLEVSPSSFIVSEPAGSEKAGDSSKLSGGIIVAIVAGVVLAVVFIGIVILFVSKNRNSKRPYPEVPETASKNDTIMVNPPPEPSGNQVMKAPAASVASVENAVSVRSAESASESQDNNSFHRSVSSTVAGESEMETFSVAAGNMEGTGTVAKSGAAGDTSASGDELSSHAMSSLRQTMISRTIVAPPGKLGIVIDTTLEGPIVFKINPQSPLEGTLFPGDIIVAIDDVDTRAMSASAITALMVRTANLRRTLTVLSEDVNNN